MTTLDPRSTGEQTGEQAGEQTAELPAVSQDPAGEGLAGQDAADQDPTDQAAARRSVEREYRPSRSVPAVIVALLLAVAAGLTAIEVAARLFGREPGVLPVAELVRLGRETRWDDPLALAAAAVVAALGVLLLVAAVWPGRVRALALTPDRPEVAVAVTYGDLRRLAAQAVERVDGVAGARVRARPGLIAVRAESPLRDARGISDQVRAAVEAMLDQLRPLRRPRVRVTVHHRED